MPPDDLIVGETAGSPAQPSSDGSLYIYSGSPTFSSVPSQVIPSPGTGSLYTGFAHAVATADFNDDSFTDIAVSINKAFVAGQFEAGRIDVLFGPSFQTVLQIPNPEPEADDGFGSALAAGDVNGDGIADLLESSGSDNFGGIDSLGSFHVFAGPTLQLVASAPCPEPAGDGTAFGIFMNGGDANGDGLTDLIAADLRDRVFVYYAPDFTDYIVLNKPPSLNENPFGESAFGRALGAADVNGDGAADILVADSFDGEPLGCAISAGGVVYAFLGPYYNTAYPILDFDPQCGDQFGEVFTIEDIDDDGRPELVIAALTADDGGLGNSGHVTIFDALPAGG